MREIKTTREMETDEWFRASSKVTRIAASSTGVRAAFTEAASVLQGFGPVAVSMVVAVEGRPPESFVQGFTHGFADRLVSLYNQGYRLLEPIKGSMNVQSDYILWSELALEGVGLFAAWPLRIAGRSVGEFHVGLLDVSDSAHLPPDEFMEAFAGALALVIDRNSPPAMSESRYEEWNQKLTESIMHGTEDGICVTDNLGYVLLLNPAAESMLGIREMEVLGRRLSEVNGRFSPIGKTENVLCSADDRVVFVSGDERTSRITGFRLSRFEHYGREYSAWYLRAEPLSPKSPAGVVECESNMNALMQHERLAVFSCDKGGRITSKSTTLASLVNAVPKELEVGASISDCALLRVAGIVEMVRRCMESGIPQVSSHEIDHSVRGPLHLSVHCAPILQGKDGIAGVQAVIEDATDIVRTRTSLLRSEERYRVFFNNAPISLIELELFPLRTGTTAVPSSADTSSQTDDTGLYDKIRVAAVNPAAAAMYQTESPAELIKRWVDLNKEAASALRGMIDVFAAGALSTCFEAACRTMEGELIQVSVSAAVAPGYEPSLSRIILSIVDITEIKSMEKALRAQLAIERLVSRISARFVSLQPERTSEGIVSAVEEIGLVLGLDTVVLFEPTGREGFTAHHVWGNSDSVDLLERVHIFSKIDFPIFAQAIIDLKVIRMDSPEDLPKESSERRIMEEMKISALLMIPLSAQGKLRGVLALASKEENRWGDENVALLRVIADVAANALDREQREHDRRESEDLLRTVFQSMVGGLIVTDREGVVLLANPSAASSLKLLNPSELIGRPLSEVVKGAAGMLRTSEPGEQQQIVLTLHDGTRCTFGFTNASAASGRRIVLFRDLSPMIESGRRQKRGEELARLGMVTAKLSHEIKNPLTSILLGLRTLEESTALGREELLVLRSVLEEVRYLKSFVGNLLDVVRFQDVVPTPQPILPIMQSVLDTQSRPAAGNGVALRMVEGPKNVEICVDSHALVRALGNLVKNAVEACEKQGEVEIGWRMLEQDEKDARFQNFEGSVVCLYVDDAGPGIPPEVMDNLFVPFTTTKTFGNGLGLSMVRETVTGHGGVIEVITPTKKNRGGTRFEILLPVGRRLSCLDILSSLGDGALCPVPDGCPVREVEGYFSCWVIKGKASMAETGRWKEECMDCPAYLAGNLEHFYIRPNLRSNEK